MDAVKILNAPVSAGPAVAEGKLVVGTNNGKVIAVDIKHGKVAWRFYLKHY